MANLFGARKDYKHNTAFSKTANEFVGIDKYHMFKESLRKSKNQARQFKNKIKGLKKKDFNDEIIKELKEYYDKALERFEFAKKELREIEFESIKSFREYILKIIESKAFETLGRNLRKDVAEKIYQITDYVRKIIINEVYNERRLAGRGNNVLTQGGIRRPVGGYIKLHLWSNKRLARNTFRSSKKLKKMYDEKEDALTNLKKGFKYIEQVTKDGKSISHEEFHKFSNLIGDYVINLEKECSEIANGYLNCQINEYSLIKQLRKLKGENSKFDEIILEISKKYQEKFEEVYGTLRKEKKDIIKLNVSIREHLPLATVREVRKKNEFKIEELMEDPLFRKSLEELSAELKVKLNVPHTNNEPAMVTRLFECFVPRMNKMTFVTLILLILATGLFGQKYTDLMKEKRDKVQKLSERILKTKDSIDTMERLKLSRELISNFDEYLNLLNKSFSERIAEGNFKFIGFYKLTESHFASQDMINALKKIDNETEEGKQIKEIRAALEKFYNQLEQGENIQKNLEKAKTEYLDSSKKDKILAGIDLLQEQYSKLNRIPQFDKYFAKDFADSFNILMNSIVLSNMNVYDKLEIVNKFLDLAINNFKGEYQVEAIKNITENVNKFLEGIYKNEIKDLVSKKIVNKEEYTKEYNNIKKIVYEIYDKLVNLSKNLDKEAYELINNSFIEQIVDKLFKEIEENKIKININGISSDKKVDKKVNRYYELKKVFNFIKDCLGRYKKFDVDLYIKAIGNLQNEDIEQILELQNTEQKDIKKLEKKLKEVIEYQLKLNEISFNECSKESVITILEKERDKYKDKETDSIEQKQENQEKRELINRYIEKTRTM